MSKTVKIYRSRPSHLRYGNFGDELTGVLLGRMFGIDHRTSSMREADLIAVGSILDTYWRHKPTKHGLVANLKHIVRPSSRRLFVWGAGAMLEKSEFEWPQQVTFNAVRGHLTAARIRGFSGAIGDAGILASLLPGLAGKAEAEVVLVPHFVDEEWVSSLDLPRHWKVAHPDRPVDDVISAISSAELVISSSLHGLITADSFGIPAVWAASHFNLHKKSLYKFHDHASARRKPFNEPLPYENLTGMSASEIVDLASTPGRAIDAWQSELMAAFPEELR